MTDQNRFYVATRYSLAERSEPEEQREVACYLDADGFTDFHGFFGDVDLGGKWHLVLAFGSEAEADRFITSWGGFRFTAEVQAKVYAHRWREREPLRDVA